MLLVRSTPVPSLTTVAPKALPLPVVDRKRIPAKVLSSNDWSSTTAPTSYTVPSES